MSEETDVTTADPEPETTTDTPTTEEAPAESDTPSQEEPATEAGPSALPVTATVTRDAFTGIYAVDIDITHPDETTIRVGGREVWKG